MSKLKTTEKALFGSVVSLLLCFTMLIGTTFAWFTDTVKNTNNKILAGDLEIKLLMHDGSDYIDISTSSAPIFGAGSIAQNNHGDTLWEPGKTEIVYLGIQNAGNLALKYNVILDIVDGGLIGALEYALIDGAEAGDIASWDDAKDSATLYGDVEAGQLIAAQNGVLDEVANGKFDETDYFALVVHMKENAADKYQGKNLTLDILINANQAMAEGKNIVLENDIDLCSELLIDSNATINLNGKTLNVAGDRAIKDRLNFDIFNGTNTITNSITYPPVRYGFGNTVYFNVNGEQVTVN